MSETLPATPALLGLHVRGLHSLVLASDRLAERPVTLADHVTGIPAVIAATFPWSALASAQSEITGAIKKHGADAVMTNGSPYRPEDFTLADLRTRLLEVEHRLAPFKKLMEAKS